MYEYSKTFIILLFLNKNSLFLTFKEAYGWVWAFLIFDSPYGKTPHRCLR